jgi:hypothetical protein
MSNVFYLDVHHTGQATVTPAPASPSQAPSAMTSVATGLILLMIGVTVSIGLLVMLIFP